MSDIEDLNPDHIFNHLSDIFNLDDEKLEKEFKIKEKKERVDDAFFTDEQLINYFKKGMTHRLNVINNNYSGHTKQAYYSAALKNYKRDLIKLHIQEIKRRYNLKLTTRAADMFFYAYLGRSVGEVYLCVNFGEDYNKKDIILTADYKKKLSGIIEKHKEEVVKNLNFIISMYRKIKIKVN